jgi:hypothetical protein
MDPESIEAAIADVLLNSKTVFDGCHYFTNSTASNTNTNTAAALTFDDLLKMAELVKPLPPPDKSRCENCKEPMHHDGQPIYSGSKFGGPACYVCGRCYLLIRRAYGPRAV